MKKLLNALVLVLAVTVLAACGQTKSQESQSSSSAQVAKQSVTLVINNGQETKKKTVTFKDGATVLDVLEDSYDVEVDDSGLITAIDGTAQDEQAKKYWMYKVNDKMAPKGAKETKVKNGDTIEFYMDTF